MTISSVTFDNIKKPWFHWHQVLAFGVFFAVYAFYLIQFADPIVPQYDALRYIDYILNLNIHGVFGLTSDSLQTSPPAGRANAPIYMMLVAAVSHFDHMLQGSLHCVFTSGTSSANCRLNLGSLYLLNSVLGAATIVVGMAISRRLSGNNTVAWLAGFFMLAFLIKLEDGLLIAPENAMLLPFFVLCWATLDVYEKRSVGSAVLVGICLAITTLVRPSYLYLLYGYALTFFALAVLTRHKYWLKAVAGVVAGFALAAAPWALRNFMHFGDFALSGGQYAEIIIAQRLAYHVLDWSQIAVAAVYWTPDFGDQLAATFAAPKTLTLLGTGPDSIYENAINSVYQRAVTTLGGTDGVLRHLIIQYVLLDPLKFTALTGVFIWRGIFVAKILGLIGVFCTALCIRHTLVQGDKRLLVLLAPMSFVVLFHAAISISIGRYNLFLLLPYSLCAAWVLHETTALMFRFWRKND